MKRAEDLKNEGGGCRPGNRDPWDNADSDRLVGWGVSIKNVRIKSNF